MRLCYSAITLAVFLLAFPFSPAIAQNPRVRVGYLEPTFPTIRFGLERVSSKIPADLIPLQRDLLQSLRRGELDVAIVPAPDLAAATQAPGDAPFLSTFELPFFFKDTTE